MKLPEAIYQGYLRTPVVPPRKKLIYKSSVNNATGTITISMLDVPTGYDFILQSLVINGIGGGAQTVSRFKAQVYSLEEGGQEAAAYDVFHKIVSGSVEAVYEWQGDLYLPSYTRFDVGVSFSAGAVGNSSYVYMTGFFVPQLELMK